MTQLSRKPSGKDSSGFESDLGPFGLVETDSEGVVRRCNARALNVLNVTRPQLVGHKVPQGLRTWKAESAVQLTIRELVRPDQTRMMVLGLAETSQEYTLYVFADLALLGPAVDELARRECVWSHALESANLGVWEFDLTQPAGQQAYFSPTWKKLHGFEPKVNGDFEHKTWLARIHPEDVERVRETIATIDAGEMLDINFDYREKTNGGGYRWLAARGKVVALDKQGRALHVIGSDVDITQIKEEEQKRSKEQRAIHRRHVSEMKKAWHDAETAREAAEATAFKESIWRHAANAAGHGVWSYEVDYSAPTPRTKVIFASESWYTMRGAEPEQQELHDFDLWLNSVHVDDREKVRNAITNQIMGVSREIAIEYREFKPDGTCVWIMARGLVASSDDLGRPKQIIGVDIDISKVKEEELRRAEEAESAYAAHLVELKQANLMAESARLEAQRLAQVDVATGLPNRRKFREYVTSLIRRQQPFAVFQVDLDHFKTVNDLHGHAAGDVVLRAAAMRLSDAVAQNGTCARLGGDEFAVALPLDGVECDKHLTLIANRIIAAMDQPVPLSDLRIQLGASVGVSVFPRDGEDYDTLLQRADMALYSVKLGQRGTFRFFDPSMGDEAVEKTRLEADVRLAIHHNEIEPWFQPIFSAESGRIEKLEVLARWNCPQRGFVSPEKFLNVASHIGMLPELTASLMRKALHAIREHQGVKLAFNITASEACDPATPVRILNELVQGDFPPERLEIEITERALIKDFDNAALVLKALRSAGIQVYIDDFGNGYAGIGYLRQLEVDGIKIDSSCVADVCRDGRAALFLSSIQGMAVTLGYKTVAEGIESADVWAKVKDIGCNFGQGFHMAKPTPAVEIGRMMADQDSTSDRRVIAFARA